jgi:hypothetical protein
MADPPITQVSDEQNDTVAEGKGEEELVCVKEGYFRYIDILFEWCKYMNPWQVSLQLVSTRDYQLTYRKTL